jgi:hypothetical protein
MKDLDRYHKWVEWNEEDQVYIGKCPDLITGIHGDDPAGQTHLKIFRKQCVMMAKIEDHMI